MYLFANRHRADLAARCAACAGRAAALALAWPACPLGGMGRRIGLKIRTPEREVPVRVRQRAPLTSINRQLLGRRLDASAADPIAHLAMSALCPTPTDRLATAGRPR